MDELENILEALVQPLGLIWLMAWIGFVLNAAKGKWLNAAWFGAMVAGMFVVGSTRIPDHLLAGLERAYATGSDGHRDAIDMTDVDAVVMLGGMSTRSEHDPLGFEVDEAFDRALAAAEIMRRSLNTGGENAPALVLGGGGNRRIGWSESQALRDWLSAWRVPTNRVLILPALRNTFEEAAQVHEMSRSKAWRRILLVTSAYHMQRAEGVFRKAGLSVVPFACDFIGLAALEARLPFNPVPRPHGFDKMRIYMHEVIGRWVYQWRGWL